MIGLELFVTFVTSMVISFSVIPIIRKLSSAYGLFDQPDIVVDKTKGVLCRRVHTTPTPRLGGLGIITGFFVSTIFFLLPSNLTHLYIGSAILFSIGMLDDLRSLPALLRLALQIVLSLYVIIASNLVLDTIYLTPSLVLHVGPTFGTILSVFIVIGAINSINLVDGLDGLAGGIVLISVTLLSMAYFLSTKDMNILLLITMPLLGSILGFLRYNTHPAIIFMGDGGSNWLGFITGILALIVLKPEGFIGSDAIPVQAHVSLFSVLCMIAVPIADTASVIFHRIRRGVSPIAPDKNHFHHLLLQNGLPHGHSVSVIYLIAAAVGIAGLLPTAYTQLNLSSIPIIAFFSLILTFIALGGSTYFWTPYKLSLFIKKLDTQRLWLNHAIRNTALISEKISLVFIYIILMVAPPLAGVPPQELGYASLFACLLLITSSFFKDSSGFFQSFIISITAATLLTAINANELSLEILHARYRVQHLYNVLFVLLAGSTFVLLLANIFRGKVKITPSDFLLVAIPLSLLFIPDPIRSNYRFETISLRSLVLFVALRLISRRNNGAMKQIKVVSACSLLYIVLVSLLGLRFVY